MADKEKLIWLLCNAHSKSCEASAFDGISYAEQLAMEADFLLENNVTFAKDTNVPSWIPVSERLPDAHGTFIVALYIRSRKRKYSDSANFDPVTKRWRTHLFWGKGMKITHWMPLPEPPK